MNSIIRVEQGRGFVIEAASRRLVLTAAHCLPYLPPAISASYVEDRSYRILGELDAEPSVLAECLFVNPVADLAVLGSPDGQAFFGEDDAFDALVEARPPVPVGETPQDTELLYAHAMKLNGSMGAGYLIEDIGGSIWLEGDEIEAGMSGSPIMVGGLAVGVVVVTSNQRDHGPNPSLLHHLPAWIVRSLGEPS